MKAAIYCRVSTEDQEREGTSLQSQMEACTKCCQEKGYDANNGTNFTETYSGLTLDRPELNKLRELIRNKQVSAVVVHCLDRLSRDPVHGIILQEEFEKAGVKLEAVTETVDSTDLGKLISYIRGYAAKLEAEKIKERTIRGKKIKARLGQIVSGSHARLYGYNYVHVALEGGGRRLINEEQARWVRDVYRWLVEERLSINAITYKLRMLNVPTPSGKGYWLKSTVHKILHNSAYIGKTYAFTQTHCEPRYNVKDDVKRKKTGLQRKPKEEWIEIPNVTPPIISEDLFGMAQERLQKNIEFARRNAKYSYLLRGLISCKRCGRKYQGYTVTKKRSYGRYENRRYRCSGSQRIETPVKCSNSDYNADKFEGIIWEQVERLLIQPEVVLTELTKQQQEIHKSSDVENELTVVQSQLNELEKEQERLLEHFLMGFPEELTKKQNSVINEKRNKLLEHKVQLEKQLQLRQQYQLNFDNVDMLCQLVKRNVQQLSFDDKRLALEALRIKVWVDGNNAEVTGSIPMSDIASTVSECKRPRTQSCLCLWWRRR